MLALVYPLKHWAVWTLILIACGCTARPAPQLPITLTTPAAPTSTLAATPRPIVTATPLGLPTLPVTRTISQQRAYSLTLQVTDTNGAPLSVDLNYLLYLPDDYGQDSQRQWPLILYLHGAGQRGDNVEQVASLGLPDLLNTRLKLPALVVSPQLPSGAYWNDYVGLLEELLDHIMTKYAIDPKRVYVTGFSMGGYGTWALGLSAPDRFAALVPVAGGWDASAKNICTLKSVPVWVFHGALDEMVVPKESEEMVKALRACGGNVRYTLIPRATHAASGTMAYLEPGLFDWLLAQSLPTETPTPFPTAISAPPIDSPVPEVVNTPWPGDGSLKPPGQHAYSVDLNIAGANGVTHTETISYLLYLPGAYGQDPQQQWPLILFMHGSGERGDDPEVVAAAGLPKLLTSTLDFPAIVLSPQAQEEKVWWGAELDLVRALLDHVQANYAVDAKRIYLTGLSMGGFGAWALTLRYPRRFAALVPIAGGWDSERDTLPRNICDIKDMPIWVFHGQQDDIVLPKKSELMVNALRKCDSAVRFTLYPDANHRESFERAYAEPELYTWMFEQRLP